MPAYNNGKYVCSLSPQLQEKAKNELNEDPARREEDIEILRQWMNKQPHINGRTDDAFLLIFLRVSKFSIEMAKQRIDSYYTMKTEVPEWFSGSDVNQPKFQKLLKNGLVLPLGHDREGRTVVMCRIGIYDPSEYNVNDIFSLIHMVSEWLLWDEKAQISGLVMVCDLTNMSGGHLAQYTPYVIKKAVAWWQESMPFRIKGIHYYKLSPFFETLYSLVKMFLKDKLQRRTFVHGSSLESLHNHIPPEILPKEYGGTAGTTAHITASLLNEMIKYQPFFVDDEKYKVDECKRPGKPKDDRLGIDGSFRKLNID